MRKEIGNRQGQRTELLQNFAEVGKTTREIVADPTVTPVGNVPVLHALKVDELLADTDGSRGVTPGDTLGYTVTLQNTGTAAATDVVFTDTPDDGVTLVAGTVTSSRGPDTVVSGNDPGDTTVTVEAGRLAPGAEVVITFDVQVDEDLPANVAFLSNQGLLTAAQVPDGVRSDDPDTPALQDPTTTPLQDAVELRAIKTATRLTD